MLVYMNTVANRSGRISMDDLSEPTCRKWDTLGKLVLTIAQWTDLTATRVYAIIFKDLHVYFTQVIFLEKIAQTFLLNSVKHAPLRLKLMR